MSAYATRVPRILAVMPVGLDLRTAQIATASGMRLSSVSDGLYRACRAGEVIKVRCGVYRRVEKRDEMMRAGVPALHVHAWLPLMVAGLSPGETWQLLGALFVLVLLLCWGLTKALMWLNERIEDKGKGLRDKGKGGELEEEIRNPQSAVRNSAASLKELGLKPLPLDEALKQAGGRRQQAAGFDVSTKHNRRGMR